MPQHPARLRRLSGQRGWDGVYDRRPRAAGQLLPQVTRTKGTFGSVEQLPGGHYRARYRGPDGRATPHPTTLFALRDARGWLALRQADIIRGQWMPPDVTPKVTRTTFAAYAEQWMAQRHRRTAPVSTTASCWISTCYRRSVRCRWRRSPPTTYAPGTRSSPPRHPPSAPTPTGCCARSWAPRSLTGRSRSTRA